MAAYSSSLTNFKIIDVPLSRTYGMATAGVNDATCCRLGSGFAGLAGQKLPAVSCDMVTHVKLPAVKTRMEAAAHGGSQSPKRSAPPPQPISHNPAGLKESSPKGQLSPTAASASRSVPVPWIMPDEVNQIVLMDGKESPLKVQDSPKSVEQEFAERQRIREREEERRQLLRLLEQLEAIHLHALEIERRNSYQYQSASAEFQESARNLLHYLALRNMDVRKLQQALADFGLSSLGRVEAHTLASIDAVKRVVKAMLRDCPPAPSSPTATVVSHGEHNFKRNILKKSTVPLAFAEGDRLLQQHTQMLLGPGPKNRKTHIMVTLPSEAAEDRQLVHDLLVAGMSVARVNCAHDNAHVWHRIINIVRRECALLGCSCRILMDLAGPKLRTGQIASGPEVMKLRSKKDVYGRRTSPARVLLVHSTQESTASETCLPIDCPNGWLQSLGEAEQLEFVDTRGKKQIFEVKEQLVTAEGVVGVWVECERTCHLTSGMPLSRVEGVKKEKAKKEKNAKQKKQGKVLGSEKLEFKEECIKVGRLPAAEGAILLNEGDFLIIEKGDGMGKAKEVDLDGRVLSHARVPLDLPQVFESVEVGEPIKLDDGKIEGVVDSVADDKIVIRITKAAAKGSKLRGEKAINLPESNLQLQGLTQKDLADLDFIAEHADMLAFSFVNDASDVEMLQRELHARQAAALGIVLKIETKRGFQNLPWMLLQGMRGGNPLGVMIARGDMAVECGWERLAEVQEMILWLCEAAHVPCIWATQVLEGMAKTGLPSRAEITDAAMGERAECVMLNKGPHIVDTVKTLDDILQRMRSHQTKKQAMLRPLTLATSEPSRQRGNPEQEHHNSSTLSVAGASWS